MISDRSQGVSGHSGTVVYNICTMAITLVYDRGRVDTSQNGQFFPKFFIMSDLPSHSGLFKFNPMFTMVTGYMCTNDQSKSWLLQHLITQPLNLTFTTERLQTAWGSYLTNSCGSISTHKAVDARRHYA